MATFLGNTFHHHDGPMDVEIWVEPFAGGAGAGLALLDTGVVEEFWMVEKNPALAALWQTIKRRGDSFAERVAGLRPTLELWEWARGILAASEGGCTAAHDDVALAAFIINRCSRSGIVSSKVGPIGGKRQDGKYTVRSRFNAEELAARISRIAQFAGGLRVIEGDAISYIGELNESGIGDEVFLFVDPPYIREGNKLYAHGMTKGQHQALADVLTNCMSPWILTYDNEPTVADDLYPEHRIVAYQIANTANRQRVAEEYAVFADNVVVHPDPRLLERGAVRWVRGEGEVVPTLTESIMAACRKPS